MILTIFCILAVAGIAYLQLRDGLYSSMVMAVLTVLSAILAMGGYQKLAVSTGLMEYSPPLGPPICLLTIFVTTLLILRVIVDKLIRRDILFSVWVNRIGSLTFGTLTGLTMVGVLVVAMQLAPFGPDMLNLYKPFGPQLRRQQTLAPLKPDDFLVGLTTMTSAGAMSGAETFQSYHPDLLQEAFCYRNLAGYGGSRKVEKESSRGGWYDFSGVGVEGDVPTDPVLKRAGGDTRMLVVRAKAQAEMSGDDDWWRLPATHFRLLCEHPDGTTGDYYPVAYLSVDAARKQWRVNPPPTPSRDEIEQGALDIPQRTALAVLRPLEAAVDAIPDQSALLVSEDTIFLFVDWLYVIPRDAQPKRLIVRRFSSGRLAYLGDFSQQRSNPTFLKSALSEPTSKTRRRNR